MTPKWFWKDGRIINFASAKTSIFCPGVQYGKADFEGIRFYNTDRGPAVFRLPEHLARFYNSHAVIDMKIPYSNQEITDAIKTLIKKEGMNEGYLRPFAWPSGTFIGLRPHAEKRKNKISVAIGVFPWDKRLKQETLRAKISPYMRIHPNTTNVRAKISGHYVNSILALQDAMRNGFDEAIMLDWMGMVAEGSAENIFMIVNGSVYTPSLDSILDGITRRTILMLARDYGYRVEETIITPEALFKSDEVFLCGTAMEILGVVEIQREINGRIETWTSKSDNVTSKFAKLYAEVVRGKHPEYSRWLTYVYE